MGRSKDLDGEHDEQKGLKT